jgi:hypothetical protein
MRYKKDKTIMSEIVHTYDDGSFIPCPSYLLNHKYLNELIIMKIQLLYLFEMVF